MSKKIMPLNLPAGLEREIAGNPAATRLETVPANCFPGLDIDVRNLDRRFFPGLLFDFPKFEDGSPAVQLRGALLVAADPNDPDLTTDSKDPIRNKQLAVLKRQLTRLAGMLPVTPPGELPKTLIFLESITDEHGNKIVLRAPRKAPLNGPVAWRIVRSLAPGSIVIGLSKQVENKSVFLMSLKWERRTYRKETGELSPVYAPGELTQSLCSPWQHDFAGCGCTYWASNHPDIVLASHPADIAEVDDPGKTQDQAQDPILWIRQELGEPVAPLVANSSLLEMKVYEINSRWRELSFVLEGREQPAPWRLARAVHASRLTVAEIVPNLERLAGIELAIALEYLYARYSVRFYDDLGPELNGRTAFIAHELLNIAIQEMSHLRWANELLSKVRALAGLRAAPPVLTPGTEVPQGKWSHDEGLTPVYDVEWRPAAERPIDDAIDDFLAAEAPSGTLEGQYARILSTLKQKEAVAGKSLHQDLIALVERIISDGVDHYSRFREIRELLNRTSPGRLVKPLTLIREDKDRDEFKKATTLYKKIVMELQESYSEAENESLRTMDKAVEAMKKFDTFAKSLAERHLGIPLLAIGRQVEKPALRGAGRSHTKRRG